MSAHHGPATERKQGAPVAFGLRGRITLWTEPAKYELSFSMLMSLVEASSRISPRSRIGPRRVNDMKLSYGSPRWLRGSWLSVWYKSVSESHVRFMRTMESGENGESHRLLSRPL